ncbi:hypothetical protein EON63_19670 [archaeon]|nr:MAG: hypothetical protein EON63_19670 [archaeon]
MGCCISSKKVNDSVMGLPIDVGSSSAPRTPKGAQAQVKSSGVQDDARSFRSKVGAIKMISRSENSHAAFLKFLENDGMCLYWI